MSGHCGKEMKPLWNELPYWENHQPVCWKNWKAENLQDVINCLCPQIVRRVGLENIYSSAIKE